MPLWILQIILTLLPILGKLAEKFIPSLLTRKREFKTKKKIMKHIDKFTTIAEIAAMNKGGKKHGTS